MENVNVETTQNVNIEYPIASIPERIAAALLDFLIMCGYGLIISIIFYAVTSDGFRDNENTVGLIIMSFFSLPILGYSLIFETFMNGQTIGKRAVRIKVMRVDGRPPTFGNYVMRWMMRLIEIQDSLGVIAMIAIAFNGKGQRLGDMAAGTMVVKTKRTEEIGKTVYTNIQEDYVPVYPEVSLLTLNEIDIIKRVLALREEENNQEAIDKLTGKLTEHLNIRPTLDGRDFLKALLKDYNKLNGRS